jgi:hypothetical protein
MHRSQTARNRMAQRRRAFGPAAVKDVVAFLVITLKCVCRPDPEYSA